MNVSGLRAAAAKRSGSFAGDAERHDAPSDSHALVVTAVAETARPPIASYRPAAFLAHLIATKDQLPQTRDRRRAEPHEAIAAYRAAAALTARH
jgi:hypothetical protein